MRTLIFGADGQLGKDLVEVFRPLGTVVGLTIFDRDITIETAVNEAVEGAKPDFVVNSAAYTDVERAEDEPELAFKVNEAGARHIANAAANVRVPVLYFSTDFVFNGQGTTPYLPNDTIAPRGVYARSKAAGEAATLKANAQSIIVRTAWLYGIGGNNFVEKILRAAQTRHSLKVVNDEVGSPTYTHDLAEAVAALCVSGKAGVFHGVNTGSCSRYDFAREILRGAGLDTAVEPCAASEYPSKAPRPAYSVLSNDALEAACGYHMPQWQNALTRYLKRRETV